MRGPDHELYSKLHRGGLDAAIELIDRAEESYCEWPTKRPLRYRDLVRYIVIDDLTRQSARGGVRANVAAVVARVVPMNW
jgi:hypothetical protein